jgi:putative FmdB family regulatory protein
MPIYEFRCGACKREFEELVFRRDEKVSCPGCGSSRVKRLLSGFAVTGEARLAGGGKSCSGCKPKAGGCSGCSCH